VFCKLFHIFVADPDELIKAIKKIAQGGKYITSSLSEKLFSILSQDTERLPHETLSDREYQVMRMLASGKTLKEIADELSLSIKTVGTYRSRILEKMGMKKNAELIHYAIKNRLIE